MGLGKVTPAERPTERRPSGEATVVAEPRIGGLHRRDRDGHSTARGRLAGHDSALPSPARMLEKCTLVHGAVMVVLAAIYDGAVARAGSSFGEEQPSRSP